MKKSFLPFLQRDLGTGFSGGLSDLKKYVGDTSTGSGSGSKSKSDYDGSKSIWDTVAANAGGTLTGLATLWSAVKGQNVAPVTNNYNSPTGAGGMSTIVIIGIALLLILVLIVAMRPKKTKA